MAGQRDHALFTMFYNTGARVSEIIDLARQTIHSAIARDRPNKPSHLWQVITRDWCVGFMLGLGTVEREAWIPILLSEGRQILQPILACTDIGRTLLPDVEANTIKQIRDSAHQHIGGAVVRLYGYNHRKRGRRQRPSGRRSS